jgi:hypothetical protein
VDLGDLVPVYQLEPHVYSFAKTASSPRETLSALVQDHVNDVKDLEVKSKVRVGLSLQTQSLRHQPLCGLQQGSGFPAKRVKGRMKEKHCSCKLKKIKFTISRPDLIVAHGDTVGKNQECQFPNLLSLCSG